VKPAAKSILFGQVCLYGGLLVCVLLKPAGLATNDGISYYGVQAETILPYAFALLGGAYFTLRASHQPEDEAWRLLRLALQVYALLIAGLVITPYAAGRWVDYLHTACGSALFFLQLVLSGWLIWKLLKIWWSVVLSLIELGAGILCALYLSPTHGFLLQFQVLFQLAFGLLLILSLQKIAPSPNKL
jgi:hypothetical protein